VVDLPFGLTEAPICFTFGFQVLVAGEDPPPPTISVNRSKPGSVTVTPSCSDASAATRMPRPQLLDM
jgi:hypothetical protein